MSKYLRFCQRCNLRDPEYKHKIRGRYSTYLEENNYICEVCGGQVIDLNILAGDFEIIVKVSDDPQFLKSMIDLSEKDMVEYQLKLNQFKTQIQQQENSRAQAANTVKCPRCGSTNITAGQRGYSLLTGFVGSGSTVNRCANCGHKWKP